MGVYSKFTEDQKAKAVKAYASDQSTVRELSKQYKVSVPQLYNWIHKAKEEAVKNTAVELKRIRLGLNEDGTKPPIVDNQLIIKEQEATIAMLKAKLLDLMIETGRL